MRVSAAYGNLVAIRIVAGIVLLVLVAYLDYITSYEIGFYVFYFVPIAMVAWAGRGTPLALMTVASTVAWGIVEVASGRPYSHAIYFPINTLIRFISFVIVAALVYKYRWQTQVQAALQEEIRRLLEKEVMDLKRLLPICANCKKIRDEAGQWYEVETYLRTHSGTEFTHGVCPECRERHYPVGGSEARGNEGAG